MNQTSQKTNQRAADGASPDTRQRVLDTAEQLFADHGIDAVSIRDITGAAKVNLGAINYHFGSKDNLIVAVVERRIAPASRERLRALEALEGTPGAKPPSLEAILEALFRPAVEQSMKEAQGGRTFAKLMARSFVDPHPAVEKTMHRYVGEVARRFDAALLRVMPELTPEDVFWRMHLLMGALHHSLLVVGRKPPHGRAVPMDTETYLRRFLKFAVAGFRASLS
jgi:AcrR family transcriptional regulator